MSDAYFALIVEGPNGVAVVVPDLPGCCEVGRTPAQALQRLRLAVHDWLTACERRGWKKPRARPEHELLRDADVQASLADGATLQLLGEL